MTQPMNYKAAGVDIDAGNNLVEAIKPAVKRTHIPGVIAELGGFGGLFALDTQAYQQPILVSATDGVGTKLRLALETNQHQAIGIDLVAMCVNDVVTCGAKPLFFLDYFATGKLDVSLATTVIEGIAKGCQQAGAALIGGETAEMPGMYQGNDYDLAGFCVGVVEKNRILDGNQITVGDAILGLPSTGVHANGFSLIRHLIQNHNIDLNTTIDQQSLATLLLEPTQIYVKPVLDLAENNLIKGCAHITGGGLTENIPRILPNNCQAQIDGNSWQQPKLFQWIQETGGITNQEMWRTFNCGIGMAIILSKENVAHCEKLLATHNITAFHIGEIAPRNDQQPSIIISNE